MEYSAAQLSYLQHLDIDVWVTRAANETLAVVETLEQAPVGSHMSALAGIVNEQPQQVTREPEVAPVNQQTVVAPKVAEQTVQQPSTRAFTEQEAPAKFGQLKAPTFPKAEPATNVSPASSVELAQRTVPHYTLQFWCYSSGLWLVSAENQLSPAHHMLAHNVAQFVHGKKRKPRHVGIFSWPMLAAPNIDQSAAVAQKYLAQHILQLSGLVECKKLLVFNDVGDTLSQHSAIEMPNSLGQLLIEPLLKKQLWQFLLSHQIES